MKLYLNCTLVLLTILIFTSCEEESVGANDDFEHGVKVSDVQEFRSTFDLSYFNDPSGQVVGNIEVNWNSFVKKEIDGITFYEFKADQTRKVSFSDDRIKGYNYTVLGTKSDDTFSLYVTKLVSFSDDLGNRFLTVEDDNFHGMIYLMNLEGGTDFVQHYQKGNLITSIEDLNVGESSSQIMKKAAPGGCQEKTATTARCVGDDALACATGGGCGGGGEGGKYVTIPTYHWTDWYNVRADGVKEWSHRQNHAITYETVWVSTGAHYRPQIAQDYARGTGTVYYTNYKPSGVIGSPTEIIVDITMKQEKCALGVLNTLMSQRNELLKSTISVFENDPEYNLIFKAGDCKTTDEACTNATKIDTTGEITITLENVNGSDLAIAALLIHEGIHAELHRFVHRHQRGVNPNDRPRLFQLYAYYKGWAEQTQDGTYNWKSDAQHNYMVEKYVTAIAKTVRQYDNNRYPLSHYMAYGWDGLTKYGYTAKRLTADENSENQRLRQIVESSLTPCN